MKNFINLALIWTATIFFMLNIVFPYVKDTPITLEKIIDNAPIWLIGFPIWITGGLIYTVWTKNKNEEKEKYEKLG